MVDAQSQNQGGDDAVCFTSGPSGAPFAAGVIHAWLAADRKRPLVAAGISTGAISAAAMRRVYQEMDAGIGTKQREQKRWEWFRRYLAMLTQDPLSAIWESVPDPVDFFASTPPVRDLSVPPTLASEPEAARRHYYILTTLGIWLAYLPLRLSTVATLAVMHVRRKEGYGGALRSALLFDWNLFKVFWGLVWHLARRPGWINESAFTVSQDQKRFIHPLFGWPLWLLSLAVLGLIGGLFAGTLWLAALLRNGLSRVLSGHITGASRLTHVSVEVLCWTVCVCLAVGLAGGMLYVVVRGLDALRSWWTDRQHLQPRKSGERYISLPQRLLRSLVLKPLGVEKGLLHPFQVQRRLQELFGGAPALTANDVRFIPVCAALQSTEQVLLRDDMDVVKALSAAVTIPGLYPPVVVTAEKMVRVPAGPVPQNGEYQLIDGSAVRSNPLPAFFEWCKQTDNADLVKRIEEQSSHGDSLHIVYNVPITYSGDAAQAPLLDCPDIVDSAMQALKLEKRRDTRQEVRQTNYTTMLERIWRKANGSAEPRGPRGPFAISADEIAPTEDLDPGNSFKPDPKKLMQIVAQGCQATLETLYSKEIGVLGHSTDCRSFLKTMKQTRANEPAEFLPGLPEVCRSCSGVLAYKPREKDENPPRGVIRSYGCSTEAGVSTPQLEKVFPHLTGDKQKVIFLGSGGVFRGAFHIGVLAAMTEAGLYPDLVIGASVGALMGGALCHMTAGPAVKQADVLVTLATVFLNVDSKIALTKTIKNASKQLGTRARSIRLSPSELARMVRRGSKADAGFAATGAPPALIDALASLFMIPHLKTEEISSEFVAGHVSEAIAHFLEEVRKETLSSLEIQTAVIGVSMLAGQAEQLLGKGTSGINLETVQPYESCAARKPVSFFSTTSYLNAKISLLLGRDFLTKNPTWNGVYAGLSSSAFPAAFAPHQEADLLPGTGSTGRYFADGGLFDNLPFFPAIEVLSAIQRAQVNDENLHEVLQHVGARAAEPNLFIAAGLNALPDLNARCDTLAEIRDRARGLSVNNKTESFAFAAKKVSRDLRTIANSAATGGSSNLDDGDLRFLAGAVPTEVVSISPTDAEHLNPTFAFCSSTGLKKQRVQRSIADGCYRSLQEFAKPHGVAKRMGDDAILKYTEEERKERRTHEGGDVNECPFYKKRQGAILCPFTRQPSTPAANAEEGRQRAEVYAIFTECRLDKVH